jgi:hypothetical protein
VKVKVIRPTWSPNCSGVFNSFAPLLIIFALAIRKIFCILPRYLCVPDDSQNKNHQFPSTMATCCFYKWKWAIFLQPIPSTALSKAWVCGRSLAGLSGSNPAEAWKSHSCECTVVSGRGLWDELITRPEKSYCVWCVWVWSWSLDTQEAKYRQQL